MIQYFIKEEKDMNQLEMEVDFFEPEIIKVSVLYERIAELENQLERSERMCKRWKDLVVLFHDQIHKMVEEQGYRDIPN